MKNKYETEISMRPVCECGYVFDKLSYSLVSWVFIPNECPKCGRKIVTVKSKKLDIDPPDHILDFCIED